MLRVGGFKIGLEGRLFLIVFVVAAVISLFLVGFVYNREKASAEKALADELIRAARIFASMLDPEDVARIPHEPPDSPLVRRYQELAQHVVDSAGLANAYTCSPVRPGQCALGIVNSSIGIDPGTLYDYGQTAAAEAWTKAFAGEMAASPIHRDEYGEWMNGVVPIRDASGRVIALAAVDVEASHVRVLLGRVLRQVMVMGVVLVAIWLGIAVVIARTVLRPVTTALARFGVLVGRVAEGDLTMEEIPVRSEDEVGRLAGAFNQMVARLRELMRQVAESTDVVFNAAQGLTAASEQSATGARQAADLVMRMAHATAQQAELAGDVRSTVKELQGAIVQIADGAAKSSEEMQQSVQLLNAVSADIDRVTQHSQAVVASAERAAEGARRGRQTMRLTVAGMARIREAVDNTAAQVRELEQLSTQIGEITNLISDIADQTNLLALNAAIEAARAGEHGRGFAVVADEVRRLAEHTAMSAREINELIQNTQARTAEAARAMEIGMKEVANGNQLASEADDALEQILALVEEAVDGMQKIAAAGEQIKIRTQQVVVAFDDLAMVTDENTAATEQMSASAGMVDENVSQLATLSQENAAAAKEVSASVEELSASAAQVAQSAETLIQTANQLQEQVRRFRV